MIFNFQNNETITLRFFKFLIRLKSFQLPSSNIGYIGNIFASSLNVVLIGINNCLDMVFLIFFQHCANITNTNLDSTLFSNVGVSFQMLSLHCNEIVLNKLSIQQYCLNVASIMLILALLALFQMVPKYCRNAGFI